MPKSTLIRSVGLLALLGLAAFAPAAHAQAGGVVTVCTPGAGDTYTSSVVPGDDPSAVSPGPGVVVVEGGGACPATEPVETKPPALDDRPCPDCPGPDSGTEGNGGGGNRQTEAGGGGGVTPVVPAPAGNGGGGNQLASASAVTPKQLPVTGIDGPMLMLIVAGLLSVAYGFRRVAGRLG